MLDITLYIPMDAEDELEESSRTGSSSGGSESSSSYDTVEFELTDTVQGDRQDDCKSVASDFRRRKVRMKENYWSCRQHLHL